jgi:hypothetical protein
MIIHILEQPITQVDCQAAVLYLYSDMRPPKGATGTVDWYMNGFISKLIKQGKISGQPQEVVMLATQGRILSPKALLLGMGRSVDMQLDRILPVWKQGALTLCHTGICQLATSIPFAENWGWDVGATVKGMIEGLIQGVEEAGKNVREFRLYLTNFDELRTKQNKDRARLCLKSIKQVSLIGY